MSEIEMTDAEEEARHGVEGWLEQAESELANLADHPEDHVGARRYFATAVRDYARKLRALPVGHPAWPAVRIALLCGMHQGFLGSFPYQYHAERKLRLLREETPPRWRCASCGATHDAIGPAEEVR